MARYAAFLRGVMPTNCKMADLKKAFEAAGFTGVKTFLASGNVATSRCGSRDRGSNTRNAKSARCTRYREVDCWRTGRRLPSAS